MPTPCARAPGHLPLVALKLCHADKGKRPAEDGDAGRAAKRAGTSADGAGTSAAGAGPSIPPPTHAHYNRLGLQAKTIKDLQNILKAWNLPVSGAGWVSLGELGAEVLAWGSIVEAASSLIVSMLAVLEEQARLVCVALCCR